MCAATYRCGICTTIVLVALFGSSINNHVHQHRQLKFSVPVVCGIHIESEYTYIPCGTIVPSAVCIRTIPVGLTIIMCIGISNHTQYTLYIQGTVHRVTRT